MSAYLDACDLADDMFLRLWILEQHKVVHLERINLHMSTFLF